MMRRLTTGRTATAAVIAAAALALTGCSTGGVSEASEATYVPYHFSYPAYDTVADSNAAASVIVEGTVTSSQAITPGTVADPETGITKQEEPLAPGEPPYVSTIYNFNITGVRKGYDTGLRAGQSIKFSQAGGTYNGVEYGTEEMAPLQPGPIKMVVLLSGTSSANYTLLNPSQGAYTYTNTPNSGAVDAAQPSDTPDSVVVADNASELG